MTRRSKKPRQRDFWHEVGKDKDALLARIPGMVDCCGTTILVATEPQKVPEEVLRELRGLRIPPGCPPLDLAPAEEAPTAPAVDPPAAPPMPRVQAWLIVGAGVLLCAAVLVGVFAFDFAIYAGSRPGATLLEWFRGVR